MASTFTVAVMGTSLTTGFYARGWTQELQKSLQVGKRAKVRVHALGELAETSNWGLAHVQPIINLRPDVALVEFINDAYASYQGTPPENMSLALSSSNFNSIVDALQAGTPNTRIILMTLVRPTATAVSTLYPNLASYDAQLASIASSRGVGWIDLRAIWGDPADYPSEYPADGVHVYLPAHLRVTVPTIASTLAPLYA